MQAEVTEKSAKLNKSEQQYAEKVKIVKDLQKSQTSKLKELCHWCEKHLQLNNFKEVKFADNDSDSDNESHTSANQSQAGS